MFYRREGFPSDDELVLCTVTKVYPGSVFANLDEYDRTAVVHITEIAPGRIRNIRDYVEENKKIICKVLRVDKFKGHVDLSLRRVNERERKLKLEQVKQEQKAEKIIEVLARSIKREVKNLYDEVSNTIFEKYEYIFQCFNDVVKKDLSLERIGINKDLAKKLEELIRERIKPELAVIKGTLKLLSYAPNGVEVIKKALGLASKAKGVDVLYLGGGSYRITVSADNFKTAEKVLEKSYAEAIDYVKKFDGNGEFIRAQ